MPLTSVIIPARNEKYLAKTVENIYQQFRGNFEVVITLDGDTEYPVPEDYPNLFIINEQKTEGIRPALNKAVANCHGDIILKVDAHCAFSEGFDTSLTPLLHDDEVIVARRYTLDLDSWTPQPRIVDYYYLSCPWTHPRGTLMMQSCPWIRRTEDYYQTDLDLLMCFQGSMWMMSRKHWDWLGGLEENGEVYAEHHEISMKTWLGGRRVMINKNAWYAHPKKDTRGYHMDMEQVYKDHDHSARYWTENCWPGQVHDFSWLIEQFWPLPTDQYYHRLEKYKWPQDWRSYYGK